MLCLTRVIGLEGLLNGPEFLRSHSAPSTFPRLCSTSLTETSGVAKAGARGDSSRWKRSPPADDAESDKSRERICREAERRPLDGSALPGGR